MQTAADIVSRIAGELERHGVTVTAEVHRRMGEAVPGLDIDAHPELAGAVEASSRESLQVVTAALHAGEPAAAMPAAAVAEAQLCARLEIPIEGLLRTYRISHAYLWEWAIELVEAVPGAPADERVEALRVFTRVLYAYLDLAAKELGEAYRSTMVHAAQDRQLRAVQAVLAGRSDELASVPYGLRRDHTALIGWGAGALRALQVLCRERRGLAIPVADELAWAWVEGPVDASSTEWADAVEAAVALGDVAAGAEGFRRSHFQAQQAQRVAAHTGALVTRYCEVALEALALEAGRQAERFVAAELGPLLDEDPHIVRLRETLAAYLATGQSAASAAAALGESDRTTAHRVRSAEARLGVIVRDRAAELSLALRWARFLGKRVT